MLLSFINVFIYKDASPSKHVNAPSIPSGVGALPAPTLIQILILQVTHVLHEQMRRREAQEMRTGAQGFIRSIVPEAITQCVT